MGTGASGFEVHVAQEKQPAALHHVLAAKFESLRPWPMHNNGWASQTPIRSIAAAAAHTMKRTSAEANAPTIHTGAVAANQTKRSACG